MNVKRMLKLADALERQHLFEGGEGPLKPPAKEFDLYDQRYGIYVNGCQTIGCMAAMACALFSPGWWAKRAQVEREYTYGQRPVALPDYRGKPMPGILDLAAWLLNLSNWDANILFASAPQGMPSPSARDAALWLRGCVKLGRIAQPHEAMAALTKQED